MAEEILRKLLLQVVKELNFDNYDLKIEPVSSSGANYTSTLYNVTVTEGERVVHMFAKVAAVGEKMRSESPKYYEIENFAYTKLLKVYEQLEVEHEVPQEHRLIFPKFYGHNPNKFEETIVLENLVTSGYQAYDRFKSIDWEYAKSAISSLAKMHALSFAYGEYYPEEFNKIIENLKFEWDLNSEQMSTFLDTAVTRAVSVVKEEYKDKLQKFLKLFQNETFPEFYKWSRKPVLGHGDYRPSNLMHRVLEDGSVDIKIVDLQTLQVVSPIVDLLYFIYTGSDEQFRAEYYHKLLDHYYAELHAAMTRLHLKPDDVYSREDFDFELKKVKEKWTIVKNLKFGLALAVFALPMVTVKAEDAPQVNEDLDMTSFNIEKTNDLYAERLNGVVNDYVKFGVL